MELVVLGSGTAIPHLARGASGYALRASSGEILLLECGPGSTRRWPSAGIEIDQVVGVLVTHHHVDHCADLPAIMFARNVIEAPGAPPVWLGPRGHGAHLAALDAVYGGQIREARGPREICELGDGDRTRVGPFEIEAREILHVDGALGVAVRCDGARIAFSGDSGACAALVDLCRGVDLALLDCSYPRTQDTTRHMNTRTVAEVARAAEVSSLVLTHLYPSTDGVDLVREVREAGYVGPLVVARDGLVLPVAPGPSLESSRRSP